MINHITPYVLELLVMQRKNGYAFTRKNRLQIAWEQVMEIGWLMNQRN